MKLPSPLVPGTRRPRGRPWVAVVDFALDAIILAAAVVLILHLMLTR
jgi:hypothetical protein